MISAKRLRLRDVIMSYRIKHYVSLIPKYFFKEVTSSESVWKFTKNKIDAQLSKPVFRLRIAVYTHIQGATSVVVLRQVGYRGVKTG